MINDNSIDFKKEYKKTHNELLDLQQRCLGFQKDWEYMKSLLDKTYDRNCKLKKENEQFKKEIQFYYDTTNDDGKQIISDLVDILEMKGMNVDWMNKRW